MSRLIAVLAVLGLSMVGCSTGEEFVFGEDDLCEWVTENEVTTFARNAFEAVGVEWDGSAALTKAHWVEDGGEYECEWALSGTEGLIYVETWPVADAPDEVVPYADLGEPNIPMSVTVSDHPEFNEDVLISNGAFGRYGFWVPTSDDQLVLSVNLGGDLEYDWEVPLFVVANGFLEEMNWTS